MNEFASEENWAMVFLCTTNSNHLSGTSHLSHLHFQNEYFSLDINIIVLNSFNNDGHGCSCLPDANFYKNLCLNFPSHCLWSAQFAIVITPPGGNFSSLRLETSGINLIKRQEELWYNVSRAAVVLWARPGNSPGHSLSPGSGLAGDWAATEMRERRWGTETGGAGDTGTRSGAGHQASQRAEILM